MGGRLILYVCLVNGGNLDNNLFIVRLQVHGAAIRQVLREGEVDLEEQCIGCMPIFDHISIYMRDVHH